MYLDLINNHNKDMQLQRLISKIEVDNNITVKVYLIDTISITYEETYNLFTTKNSMRFLEDLALALETVYNLNKKNTIIILIAIQDHIYDIYIGAEVSKKVSKTKKTEILNFVTKRFFDNRDYINGLLSILKKLEASINFTISIWEILLFVLLFFIFMIFKFTSAGDIFLKACVNSCSNCCQEAEEKVLGYSMLNGNNVDKKDETSDGLIHERLNAIKKAAEIVDEIERKRYLNSHCVLCMKKFQCDIADIISHHPEDYISLDDLLNKDQKFFSEMKDVYEISKHLYTLINLIRNNNYLHIHLYK